MNKKLGEILVSQGYITKIQLSVALLLQKYLPLRIGEIFKYCGWISEAVFLQAFALQYNVSVFDFKKHGFQHCSNTHLHGCLKDRYIKCYDRQGRLTFLIEDISIALMIKLNQTYPDANILLISHNDFSKYLQVYYHDELLDNAVNLLSNKTPEASAKSIDYRKLIIYFGVTYLVIIKLKILFFLHSVANILFSIIQTIFKTILLIVSFISKKKSYVELENYNLPIYSILIPLYKEANKAERILRNISNLDYPKHKLDVKIIIEEDDLETRRAFDLLELPDYIDLVLVPFCQPRTKPKAMNYALQLVRGEYLVIYDAEDAPSPDQLKKAVMEFKRLPEEYVCLQGRLEFYNANENLLTRIFSIEYGIWFRYLLKGLDFLDIPIPLGGTSNHFKVSKLQEILAWDPYNVTEDADLGIRIGIAGYKSSMLDSVTNEECLTDIHAWFFQRIRWIKGFIKTYIIYIKNRPNNSIKKDLAIHCFIGLSTYNFIVLPWLIAFGFFYYEIGWIQKFLDVTLLVSVFFNYFSAFCVIYQDYKKNGTLGKNDIFALLLWPFYFILHSIAAYVGLFELFYEPFRWNKTMHGTSKVAIDEGLN